ncbi:GtrA family protein [Acidisoma sp. C75]
MTQDRRDVSLTHPAAPLPLAENETAPRGLTSRLARHIPLAQRFIQFGVVGTIGFGVDYAVVHTAHFGFGVGLVPAGLLSFFVAATVNWFLNRIWTFRGRSTGRLHHEWMRYLATNGIGFVLNRGTYIALVTTSPLCIAHPVIALAAGSIAGLWVNFFMSARVVFR